MSILRFDKSGNFEKEFGMNRHLGLPREWEAGKRVVIRSPCAGAALDPPSWTIVPNKYLSLSLSLS
jgi:hypothetical protein